ncbi:hypothetical protein D3C79_941420 [compost metagenome]
MPCLFHNHIRGIVDYIAVVTSATHQLVDTPTTIEEVVASTADDGVGQSVTHPREVATAGKGQVLQIGPQGVAGEVGLHQVRAPTSCLADGVASIVDDEGVVARATGHGICT